MAWGEPRDRGQRTPDRVPAAEAGSRTRAASGGMATAIWALVGFMALSLWARSGFRHFPPPPPEWRSWLGRPPPLVWIHSFLVLYLFSALVLSIARLSAGRQAFTGFRHLAYLTAFYVFYAVADGLEDNFWAVFVGGLSVLGLETYRHWTLCRRRHRDIGDVT